MNAETFPSHGPLHALPNLCPAAAIIELMAEDTAITTLLPCRCTPYISPSVTPVGGVGGGQPIIINGPIVAGGSTTNPAPVVTDEPVTPPVATETETTPAPGPIVIGGSAPVVMGGAPVMPAGAPVAICGANTAPVVAPANIEEMDKATEEYVEKVRELTEAIQRISQQTEVLGRSMSEMDTLSRNLTGVNALYEVHLRSAGGQLNAIDQVNDQTKKMAQQIEELNNLYARMIEAMTSRIDRPQI